MSTVKKALVLAAGYGTRLKPFTCVTPKPLLPIWGVPLIDRVVELLRERGVEEIVVNAHHLHEQIEAWAAERKIRVSYEPEILGSGGALNPLRDWIGNEPFYLVNSDILVENAPDLSPAFAQAERNPEVLGVCLVSADGPRTIEVEPMSGYVTNWRSDDAGVEGTFTYCGLTILKPAILDYVTPTGASSVVTAFEKAMMEGHFLKTVTSDDLLWEDAGSVEKYIALNHDETDAAFADIPQLKATQAKDFKFLFARGSNRVFFSCDKGIAIVYDDFLRDENARYAGHARWLKAKGIPVPEVIFDDSSLKTIVLENVGQDRKKMGLEEYAQIVELLARFNALGQDSEIGQIDLQPAFDLETWKWERELFCKYCLEGRYHLELSPAVQKELLALAARLEAEPKALVHRDCQSTNVLWKNDRPSLIDFQGMRLGPAAYDLASLLYDPYVELTEEQRHVLTALYEKCSGRTDLAAILPLAATQRLLQCLGAYGRLASVGQASFTKYIEPALEHLLAAADEAGLEALGGLAEELIARERDFHAHTHTHE